MAHLAEGVLGRSGEARGPEFEKKTIFEIDEIPNLLHSLVCSIPGLLYTIGGYSNDFLTINFTVLEWAGRLPRIFGGSLDLAQLASSRHAPRRACQTYQGRLAALVSAVSI